MKKLLLCCMAMMAMYQLHAQTLIAHYTFNGLSGAPGSTVPDVVNGLNGTLMGPAATPVSGGLQMGTGTYVQVSGNPLLNLQQWTVSVNVTFNTFNTGTCQENKILSHGSQGNVDYYSLQTDDNNWERTCNGVSNVCGTASQQQQFYGVAAGGSTAWNGFSCTPILQTGTQYCLIATYNGNAVDMYVNGTHWLTLPMYAGSSPSATPFLIIGGGASGYFDGIIEDVQIWDGPLSGGQISGYACSSPLQSNPSSSCSDTCYWKVTGNNIIGGNNIFGTLTNHDVDIWTNDTSRGRFTANGNLSWGQNAFPNVARSNIAIGGGNTIQDASRYSLAVGMTNKLMNSSSGGSFATTGNSILAGETNTADNNYQSFIFGEANLAQKGEIVHIFGNSNKVYNTRISHAGGGRNFIDSSYYVYAEGYANKIVSSNVSQTLGDSNSIYGSRSVLTIGDSNHVVNSLTSVTEGYSNNITGSAYSMANGRGNTITSGTGVFIGGNVNRALPGTIPNNANTIFGQDNTIANSQMSSVMGVGNNINAANTSLAAGATNNVNGSNSVAIGKNNYIQGNDIHLYGEGLTNNSPNSISIGMQGRAITVTNRGVAIQMQPGSGSVWTPIHNLDVEAAPVAGVLSNIAFHHLPATNTNLPLMVIDTTTGEIFRVPNTVLNFASSQGISQTGNVFRLGDSCGAATLNPFTTNRTIHVRNNNLYFNTFDNGKLFMGPANCQPLATRLEISGNGLTGVSNSYATGAPALSGLRFSTLTHQLNPIAAQPTGNGKYGVLSLDNEGDVIWVEDQAGGSGNAANGVSLNGSTVELGEACNNRTGAADLNSDRAVPMNDNNLVFADGSFTLNNQGQGKNRIGIGTSCAPAAKLEVIRNTEPNPYDADNRAIAGINLDMAAPAGPNGLGAASGVYGEAGNFQNPLNLGGDFKGISGHMETYGVRGRGDGMNVSNAVYGGWFSACGALGTDPTGSTTYNIGVYGEVCNKRGWAGYFNGITYCTAGVWTSSDSKIKKNVEPISNALGIIDQLQPKKYQYNTAVYPGLNLPDDVDNYGVIAQDLEKVLPALVKTTPVPGADGKGLSGETIKTVNYTELIPILIQAVKEQQQTINTLKAENEAYKKTIEERLNQLQQSINNICENGCGGNNTKATDGGAAKDQLYQSVPNPADSKTMISYTLVRNYENAQIVISDMNGRAVQTIDLQATAGNGNVTVDLSTFSAQQYIYSLYVNGRSVDSKKMMIVR